MNDGINNRSDLWKYIEMLNSITIFAINENPKFIDRKREQIFDEYL